MKIAFVTNPRHPDLEDDDRPLAEALARRGVAVVAASWDEEGFDWAGFDVALLRSPWDYPRRAREFLDWLARVEALTRVVNPPSVIRWNANKRYLGELAALGVNVVPTAYVARNESVSLATLCAVREWDTVVLKPAVSADSWETIRVTREETEVGQQYLDRHRKDREIMVQPFVPDVEQGGEQTELVACQRQPGIVVGDARSVLVDLEWRSVVAVACGPLHATQDRAYPRGDLARAERLRHIVVSPKLEADDAIDLVRACRQEDHRHFREAS